MHRIIADIRGFIKLIRKSLTRDDVVVSLIIVFVALASFLAGSYSQGKNTLKPSFVFYDLAPEMRSKILNMDASVNLAKTRVGNEAGTSKTTIFGSKNGKKYYFSWCSGANRVKLENRVYYQTEEVARSSGRTIAAGCNQ